MAKKIEKFTNFFQIMPGGRDEAIKFVKQQTAKMRVFYEDEASKQLSPKAEKIKKKLMGFGNAMGEQLAMIFSEVLEEDITFKQKQKLIPFIFMAALKGVKIDGCLQPRNISFMLVEMDLSSWRPVFANDVGQEKYSFERRFYTPLSDTEIESAISDIYNSIAEGGDEN